MHDITQMYREVREIPDAVDRLLSDGAPAIARIARAVADDPPRLCVTVARGSSDHACTYLKYAFEIAMGLPVASIGPSVASIYGAELALADTLCLSVSQSGQSPDIVAMTRAAARGGSRTVAITNNVASDLGAVADHVIDIHAGPELSVAATKTFVTSALSGLMLLAELRGDAELRKAIHALPDRLGEATECDWSALRAALGGATSLYTLGRGPSWAMSNEAALKFKETCQIHAESFSSAEVLHGPVSIVEPGFPALCLASHDAAEADIAGVADRLAGSGATAFVTSAKAGSARVLPAIRTGHPLTDPLALIVSFYAMIEAVARDRGIDPDAPRHLKKVTRTV